MESFAAGALAGLAIAMPPGAVATLILATGLRRGFAFAAAAGLGAATIDLLYASLALLLGSAIATIHSGWERPLQLLTGTGLVAFGLWGAGRAMGRDRVPRPSAVTTRDLAATYVRFAAITAVNPATLGYFVAIAIGLGGGGITSIPAFAAGVAAASAAWQLFLAAISGTLHGKLPDAARTWALLGGNLIVVLLGALILARALA